ncbi:GNAT family N-acetyltransferase [Streptomyces sp. TLI_171]|uniref:GNAT family N-acetyltransferase n=1 Tax=Streptomyces sp. TLI_171 TaxID=1938859 RepID=UPI000C181BB9|nr:GNAT family N-acetyltransferase [Streptomyces sp. TLI_171]
MLELTTEADLRAATDDDSLLSWAAQGFAGETRAWMRGRAVAVAAPDLSGRDRVAVRGPVDELAPLLRQVLALVGPSYRPLGDAELLAALVAREDGLELRGRFGWMHRSGPLAVPTSDRTPAVARWLAADELDEAADLIDRHFPDSHAHPHRSGTRAWAGVRDSRGRLTALAADAWPAPGVGLLAGVVTDPEHGRGRGHGEAACRLVLTRILRRSPRAALMVHAWNEPAIRLYRRLGLQYRLLDAAAQRGAGTA